MSQGLRDLNGLGQTTGLACNCSMNVGEILV